MKSPMKNNSLPGRDAALRRPRNPPLRLCVSAVILLAALLLCAFALSSPAQTNTILVNVGDYGLNPQRTTVTWTLLAPNPRTINGVLIAQQPIGKPTGADGKAYFTNIIWGKYRLDIVGTPGTSFTANVGTNTLGLVNAATLVTNTAALPPNPGSNYYTMAQVDALLSGIGGGAGDVTSAQLKAASNVLASAAVTISNALWLINNTKQAGNLILTNVAAGSGANLGGLQWTNVDLGAGDGVFTPYRISGTFGIHTDTGHNFVFNEDGTFTAAFLSGNLSGDGGGITHLPGFLDSWGAINPATFGGGGGGGFGFLPDGPTIQTNPAAQFSLSPNVTNKFEQDIVSASNTVANIAFGLTNNFATKAYADASAATASLNSTNALGSAAWTSASTYDVIGAANTALANANISLNSYSNFARTAFDASGAASSALSAATALIVNSTNTLRQILALATTRNGAIYAATNGINAIADGSLLRPWGNLSNACRQATLFEQAGVHPHVFMGEGTFDLWNDGLLWWTNNCTLQGAGINATILYSTNYISGSTLNLTVQSMNSEFKGFSIKSDFPLSQTAAGTAVFPMLMYNASNSILREISFWGMSDNINFGASAVNLFPHADVWHCRFDSVWDVMTMAIGGTGQSNALLWLHDCSLNITRTNNVGPQGSGVGMKIPGGGTVRMDGGEINVWSHSNLNTAMYLNDVGASDPNRGYLIANGVRFNTGYGSNGVGFAWYNIGGNASQILLNNCYNANGTPLAGWGPATFSQGQFSSLTVTNPAAGVTITANTTNGAAVVNTHGNFKAATNSNPNEVNFGINGNKTNGLYMPNPNTTSIADHGTNSDNFSDGSYTNYNWVSARAFAGDGSGLTGTIPNANYAINGGNTNDAALRASNALAIAFSAAGGSNAVGLAATATLAAGQVTNALPPVTTNNTSGISKGLMASATINASNLPNHTITFVGNMAAWTNATDGSNSPIWTTNFWAPPTGADYVLHGELILTNVGSAGTFTFAIGTTNEWGASATLTAFGSVSTTASAGTIYQAFGSSVASGSRYFRAGANAPIYYAVQMASYAGPNLAGGIFRFTLMEVSRAPVVTTP